MLGTIFGREPAAIAAFIAIAINLFISFGLKLSTDQVALINALVVAGLGLIVRSQVTPVAYPNLEDSPLTDHVDDEPLDDDDVDTV